MGDIVFLEGDAGDKFYAVLEGRLACGIVKNANLLNFLKISRKSSMKEDPKKNETLETY